MNEGPSRVRKTATSAQCSPRSGRTNELPKRNVGSSVREQGFMWATIETSEQMHCIMWDTIATEATKTGSVRPISTLKALHDVGYYGNL